MLSPRPPSQRSITAGELWALSPRRQAGAGEVSPRVLSPRNRRLSSQLSARSAASSASPSGSAFRIPPLPLAHLQSLQSQSEGAPGSGRASASISSNASADGSAALQQPASGTANAWEEAQRWKRLYEERVATSEQLMQQLQTLSKQHSICESEQSTLAQALSHFRRRCSSLEGELSKQRAETAKLREERESERVSLESERSRMSREVEAIRQEAEVSVSSLHALIDSERLDAHARSESAVADVWQAHLRSVQERHQHLLAVLQQGHDDAARSREDAKQSVDSIAAKARAATRRMQEELKRRAHEREVLRERACSLEQELRAAREEAEGLRRDKSCLEERVRALEGKLTEANETIDRQLASYSFQEQRMKNMREELRKFEEKEKTILQQHMETIDLMRGQTGLQAVQLVKGGVLQRTLSLAVSEDPLTRTKARAVLTDFVRAHNRDDIRDRDLNEALAAVELIQNWMERVERAVLDPNLVQDVRALIKQAQLEFDQLETVLGCRFQTCTDLARVVMLHVIPGRPAYAAGLRDGDMVSEVSGKPTPDKDSFQYHVRKNRPGETLSLTVHRGDEDLSLEVMAGARGKTMQQVHTLRRLASGVVYSSDLQKHGNAHAHVVRSREEKGGRIDVFLGGSCNPTAWRREIAIPMLEEANVSFYNPQVDDWTPELVQVEARAKRDSRVLLFVIDKQTRAVGGMLEAAEYIGCGRRVVLVILNVEEGATISGTLVSEGELKDLNRGRSYLADVASRHGTPCFTTVEDATRQVIEFCKGRLQVRGVVPNDVDIAALAYLQD